MAAPDLTELDYDIGALTPSWSTIDKPSVSNYTVVVWKEKEQIRSFPAGNTTPATIAITLGPAVTTYTVKVQATGHKVEGPFGTVLAPLLTMPGKAQLNYTGTAMPFAWTPDSNPMTTEYLVVLFEDGTELDSKTATESPATLDLSVHL